MHAACLFEMLTFFENNHVSGDWLFIGTIVYDLHTVSECKCATGLRIQAWICAEVALVNGSVLEYGREESEKAKEEKKPQIYGIS